MAGATRGRPKVTDKTEILTNDGEKIVMSYIEDDKRIQISIPESWDFKTMAHSAGRRRLDLVDSNSNGAQAKKTTAKPRAKKVAAPKTKPKTETKPVDDTSTAPVKRRRRRKTAAAA